MSAVLIVCSADTLATDAVLLNAVTGNPCKKVDAPPVTMPSIAAMSIAERVHADEADEVIVVVDVVEEVGVVVIPLRMLMTG